MTENELSQAYFESIKIYLNNFLEIESLYNAPMPIQLAIEKLIEYGSKDRTIQSEGIADLKISYFEPKDFPPEVLSLISPYKNIRW